MRSSSFSAWPMPASTVGRQIDDTEYSIISKRLSKYEADG